MHDFLVLLIGNLSGFYLGWTAYRDRGVAINQWAKKTGIWLAETRFIRKFVAGTLYMQRKRGR
jgi:hypothetical protein